MKKSGTLIIRPERPEDYKSIYALTRAAFADSPVADGDEQDIIDKLRAAKDFIPELSLIAESGGRPVGHILFTPITIGGHQALCVGPVSVRPLFTPKKYRRGWSSPVFFMSRVLQRRSLHVFFCGFVKNKV